MLDNFFRMPSCVSYQFGIELETSKRGKQMAFNTDRIFYSAFNDCGKHGVEAIVDPSMTRQELVENIRRGELGFDNIVKVIAYNPVEGWSIDATDDVLADVAAEAQRLQDAEDFPLSRTMPSVTEIMTNFDNVIALLKAKP